MRTSTEVFDLIKTMTASEKRYFKVVASQHAKGGKNNYVRIFEAIDKQKEYDEEKLLKHFKGENFVKQFSVAKNYLHQLLLRSLRGFHEEKSIRYQMNVALSEIQILYQRSLYEQCAKRINKALKIARQYELHPYELLLKGWEEETAHARGKIDQVEEYVADGFDYEDKLLLEYGNYRFYRRQTATIWAHTRRTGMARPDERQPLNEKLDVAAIEDESLALSFRAKHQLYFVLSQYYRQMGDLERSYDYRKKHAQLFHENPHFMEEHQKSYLFVLNNLGAIQFALNAYEELPATLNLVNAVKPEGERIEVLHFSVISSLALSLWVNTGQVEGSAPQIENFEKGFERYGPQLCLPEIQEFAFLMAAYYLIIGQYKDSLRWINHYLNADKGGVLQDWSAILQLLNVLVHYHLENYDYLENLHRSAKRSLKKSNKLYAVEEMVLNFFKKNLDALYDKQSARKAFAELAIQLQPESKSVEAYFNFEAWAQAQARDVHTADVLLERNAGVSPAFI